MIIKKCLVCEKEFETDKYNKVVCSSSCFVTRRNELSKLRKRKYCNKMCGWCKKEFVTYWTRKKFCCYDCKVKYQNSLWYLDRPWKSNKRYSLANELRKQSFSPRQMSIILGTLLGDGCLIKSSKSEESTLYRLSWTHGEPQKDYIDWKCKEMKPFTTNGVIKYIRKKGGFPKKDGSQTITFHSVTIGHDDLSRIKGILYRGKKKFVTRKYLDMLDELSLAVWYMDDGSFFKRFNNCVIYTNSMSISEQRTMQKYFWQRWGVKCTIGSIKPTQISKMDKYYCLRFTVPETEKLHNIISKHIIPSMQYKLNPQRLIR